MFQNLPLYIYENPKFLYNFSCQNDIDIEKFGFLNYWLFIGTFHLTFFAEYNLLSFLHKMHQLIFFIVTQND